MGATSTGNPFDFDKSMPRAHKILELRIHELVVYCDQHRELPHPLGDELYVLRLIQDKVDWEHLSLEDEARLSRWLVNR